VGHHRGDPDYSADERTIDYGEDKDPERGQKYAQYEQNSGHLESMLEEQCRTAPKISRSRHTLADGEQLKTLLPNVMP